MNRPVPPHTPQPSTTAGETQQLPLASIAPPAQHCWLPVDVVNSVPTQQSVRTEPLALVYVYLTSLPQPVHSTMTIHQ